MIGKFVEEDGLSTIESFKKALRIIRGSYAFALMDSEDASTIYVSKNKSPLLIGLGDGYNMVCSDAMAMIRETNQYMEIHDQELVIVKLIVSKFKIMMAMLKNVIAILLSLTFLILVKGHTHTICSKKSMSNQQ